MKSIFLLFLSLFFSLSILSQGVLHYQNMDDTTIVVNFASDRMRVLKYYDYFSVNDYDIYEDTQIKDSTLMSLLSIDLILGWDSHSLRTREEEIENCLESFKYFLVDRFSMDNGLVGNIILSLTIASSMPQDLFLLITKDGVIISCTKISFIQYGSYEYLATSRVMIPYQFKICDKESNYIDCKKFYIDSQGRVKELSW